MNKELKYISVAGYGSTGSSAVVNLLEELTSCHVVGGEFRFIQDPDGLEDLCSNLTNSWGWVRSDAFVRRFIKYTDIIGRDPHYFQFGERLDILFNNKFFKYRDEFLSEIIDTTWNGYWFYHDYHERNFFEVFIERIKRYSARFGVQKHRIRSLTKKTDMYFVRHDIDSYFFAKAFIKKLFSELIGDLNKSIVLDQLILPYNRNKFELLFENLKQIVVDRDPRDVYLDAKNYNAYPITNDINTFISFYESVHLKEKLDLDDNVLTVQFEDLIYKYDEEKDKIFNFLGFENSQHINFKEKFNPDVSIKNTQTWLKPENSIYLNDIRMIESKLKEWCYDF
ncbi:MULTISPECIES: hypothetical protein [unclassified Marinomonas]|uniref:hypothetical protein n=1 Tax=unclassified Marinomonas TaxID=196814 RepID=UPI0012F62E13|nr:MULTISPECIES: hypothetical protein [unclassified Marinomonas]